MPALFSRVGEVLRHLAPRLGLEAKLLERRIRQRWEEIVGDQVARHTQPGTVRFKKLTVHARSSIWVQQLTFLKPTLLDKINEAAGGPVISDLVLRVGELDDRRPDQRHAAAGQEQPVAPPSEADLEDAARHVLAVRDEELRERLRRLIAGAPTHPAGGGATSAPPPPEGPPRRPDRSRPGP